MEINISANSLFHFTPKKEFLLNILDKGFYPRYSLENFDALIEEKSEIVFPMVSFVVMCFLGTLNPDPEKQKELINKWHPLG